MSCFHQFTIGCNYSALFVTWIHAGVDANESDLFIALFVNVEIRVLVSAALLTVRLVQIPRWRHRGHIQIICSEEINERRREKTKHLQLQGMRARGRTSIKQILAEVAWTRIHRNEVRQQFRNICFSAVMTDIEVQRSLNGSHVLFRFIKTLREWSVWLRWMHSAEGPH